MNQLVADSWLISISYNYLYIVLFSAVNVTAVEVRLGDKETFSVTKPLHNT